MSVLLLLLHYGLYTENIFVHHTKILNAKKTLFQYHDDNNYIYLCVVVVGVIPVSVE